MMERVEVPKRVKRKLRDLVALAWERELTSALEALAQQCDAWRAGQIDAWELDERIHKYHNGKARDLYKQYHGVAERLMVASGLARRILKREEIPDDVWPYVGPLLTLFEGYPDIAGSPGTSGE